MNFSGVGIFSFLAKVLIEKLCRSKKFWEEPITFFPLVRHGHHRERKNWRETQTHRQQGDIIALLKKLGKEHRQMGRHGRMHRQAARLFHKPPFIFGNKGSRLKIKHEFINNIVI
jgi:hypothetical protein